MRAKWRLPLVIAAVLMLVPALASAQSSIVGQIRDESGGVLPGVSVTAASPALIEQSRTTVTDDQGRYRVDALRPGTYKLTFSLPGFSTVVRDGITVSSDVTVTANADLKVGALEETVTVSGQTAQVDVQQASRTQVISRDVIDTLPVSRNVMSIGVLAPGVRQGTPDIGGSRMTEQVSLRAHGLAGNDAVSMPGDSSWKDTRFRPSGQLLEIAPVEDSVQKASEISSFWSQHSTGKTIATHRRTMAQHPRHGDTAHRALSTSPSAAAITLSIDMSQEERALRMRVMRRIVAGRSVFSWASDILEGLESLWIKPLQYATREPEDAPVCRLSGRCCAGPRPHNTVSSVLEAAAQGERV